MAVQEDWRSGEEKKVRFPPPKAWEGPRHREGSVQGDRADQKREVGAMRCTLTQIIESMYCGFQSHAGETRYEKFHGPIMVEPADCRGSSRSMGRSIPLRWMSKGRCFQPRGRSGQQRLLWGWSVEVRGVPLRSQVVTAAYEGYVRQKWARANNLTGSIKPLEHLMGTTTGRTQTQGRALNPIPGGYLNVHWVAAISS